MPQNLVYTYPLDLSGNNPTNLVRGETHTLEPTTTNRGFALNFGPFFTRTLKIKHVESGNYLAPRNDYTALHLDERATRESGQEVCIAVLITNENLSGDFEVDYQVVGGEYSSYVSVIMQLVEALQLDNRPVMWGSVIATPDQYPPAPHLHDIGDTYGYEYLVDSLARLEQAILYGDTLDHAQMKVDIRNARAYAKTLTDALADNTERHYNDQSNPHSVKKDQVGMGNVDNFKTATPEQAADPAVGDAFMTPALTHHAIANSPRLAMVDGEIQRLWDAVNGILAILAAGRTTSTVWSTLTAWATLSNTSVTASRNTSVFIPAGPDRISSWTSTWTTAWSSSRVTSRSTYIGSTWNTQFTQNTTRDTNVSAVTIWNANTSRDTQYSKVTQTSLSVVQNTTVSSSKVTTFTTSWTEEGSLTYRTSTWVTGFYSVASNVSRQTSASIYQEVWQEATRNTVTSWYSHTPVLTYSYAAGVWITSDVTRVLRTRTTQTVVSAGSRQTSTTWISAVVTSFGHYNRTTTKTRTTTTSIGANVAAYLNSTWTTTFSSNVWRQRNTTAQVWVPNLIAMSRSTSRTTSTSFSRVTSFSQVKDTTTTWTVNTVFSTQYSKTTAWTRNTSVVTTIVQQTSNAVAINTNFSTNVAMSQQTSAVTSVTVQGSAERYSTRSTSWESSWNTAKVTNQMTEYVRNTNTSW